MRLIDADALKEQIENFNCKDCNHYNFVRCRACQIDDALTYIDDAPTIGDWISVKDDLPKEHDSIFANHPHLSKHMWVKESDNVIVYVRFPDGTGRSTEGRLQDGKWWTRVSPMLEPVVTHWMPLPEPPEVKLDGET